MSGKRRDGFDVRQMRIDWNGTKSVPPADPSAEPPQDIAVITTVPAIPTVTENRQPALRLRWDFRTRFPEPLPDAVDAGRIAAEDALPQSVEAIHQEHGRKMLGALSDLDAVMDDRRDTPSNLLRPKSDTLSEPTRLQRWYSSLLGIYEEWFGSEAAEAFDKAVRAWHAHIEVVVDKDTANVSNTTSVTPVTQLRPTEQPNDPSIIDAEVCASPASVAPPSRRLSAPAEKRIIARLPVPKPLAASVAAGHFGTDEQGQPIHPSADEVYAITNDHAENLIELIQCLPARGQAPSPELEAAIQIEVAKYAEDFGDHAAQRLEAYCRRQARVREDVPAPRGR